jgi:hypothetical protein
MAEFEGNVLRPPGSGVTKTVAAPEELLASYNPPPLIKGGTVLSGVGIVRAGEPMKRSTDGKTWVKAAFADATALNKTAFDATNEAHLADLVFGGVVNVKVAAITAANAAALATALGGRYIPKFEYLKF